jgi:hypothetical protein
MFSTDGDEGGSASGAVGDASGDFSAVVSVAFTTEISALVSVGAALSAAAKRFFMVSAEAWGDSSVFSTGLVTVTGALDSARFFARCAVEVARLLAF